MTISVYLFPVRPYFVSKFMGLYIGITLILQRYSIFWSSSVTTKLDGSLGYNKRSSTGQSEQHLAVPSHQGHQFCLPDKCPQPTGHVQ